MKIYVILTIANLWYTNAQCFINCCTHLSNVQSLTLKAGSLTSSRRSPPRNQISCAGNNCRMNPSTVQCVNSGRNDKGNYQWACTAASSNNYIFDSINVVCEGCEFSGDSNIYVGSCSLVYTDKLKTTPSNPTFSISPPTSPPTIDNTPYLAQPGFIVLWIGLSLILIFGIWMCFASRCCENCCDKTHPPVAETVVEMPTRSAHTPTPFISTPTPTYVHASAYSYPVIHTPTPTYVHASAYSYPVVHTPTYSFPVVHHHETTQYVYSGEGYNSNGNCNNEGTSTGFGGTTTI